MGVKLWFCVCLFCLSAFDVAAQEKYIVDFTADVEIAGSNYIASSHIFSVTTQNCSVSWYAIESKEGQRWLDVKRACDRSFDEQSAVHLAILAEINQRFPLASFSSLAWGSFCSQSDWRWCVPIARASLVSPDYIDYRRNYPESRLTSVNGLFVEIANQLQVYKSLSDAFSSYGLGLKLDSVEKVFAQKLGKMPFYAELIGDVATQTDTPRVMYDVGMAVFSIAPR